MKKVSKELRMITCLSFFIVIGLFAVLIFISTDEDAVSNEAESITGLVVMNSAPTLSNTSVSPASGTAPTIFTFSVVYSSPENIEPLYKYVYINGQGYPLTKQEAGDNVYSDGCIYVYSTALSPGTYTYSFSVCVGTDFYSTPSFSGPIVVSDSPPSLTYCTVTPCTGDTLTYFTFTVTYWDNENTAPYYMLVCIDGSNYSMTKQNLSDTNYVDGCVYTYGRTLQMGSHSYYFSASDGYATVTTATCSGPTVTNNVPTLTIGFVSASNGSTLTVFKYAVTYIDLDNDAPSYVQVYIDGKAYTMSKQDSGDITYINGCVYTYNRTLPIGSHTYYFIASDSYRSITTQKYAGPTVTNFAPTLTNGILSPSSGNTGTIFTFTVMYTDADNNAPALINVQIDGKFYAMSKQNEDDFTYTDGCVYMYSTTLSAGYHTYSFLTSDGYTRNTTWPYEGSIVNITTLAMNSRVFVVAFISICIVVTISTVLIVHRIKLK